LSKTGEKSGTAETFDASLKIINEKKSYRIIFPIGRKNPTRIFDWGMFNPSGPFGRNSPTHCFKWGFSEWENFSKKDQMGETFSNLKCLWDFSPYGKNNPIGFFLPWDISWDS
jgi:hypothetical protein